MSGAGKFYVATDYLRKPEAREVADMLEARGLRLNARWITNQPVFLDNGLGGELEGEHVDAAIKIAQEDLEDIEGSNLFVQLTSGEKARGGRHVELGYAIARAVDAPWRQVVVVGPREHAFHYHPIVTHLATAADLSAWAAGYVAGARR